MLCYRLYKNTAIFKEDQKCFKNPYSYIRVSMYMSIFEIYNAIFVKKIKRKKIFLKSGWVGVERERRGNKEGENVQNQVPQMLSYAG